MANDTSARIDEARDAYGRALSHREAMRSRVYELRTRLIEAENDLNNSVRDLDARDTDYRAAIRAHQERQR